MKKWDKHTIAYTDKHFPSFRHICPGGSIYARFVRRENDDSTYGKDSGMLTKWQIHKLYVWLLLTCADTTAAS